MTSFKQRLSAVLLALVMVLGVLPALSETPQVPPSMEVEIRAEYSPMLGSLVAGFTGGQDEGLQTMADTVVAALNKLTTRITTGPGGVSGYIGTQTGELVNFQAAVDPATKEALATTSLLPGLSLTLDPKLLAQFTPKDTLPQVSPQQMRLMAAPYLDAIAQVAQGYAEEATVVEGPFLIEGYGAFTKQTQFVLTSHMLADLLTRLGEVYKADEGLRPMLEEALKAGQATGMEAAGEAAAAVPEDLGEELIKAGQKGKEEPNKPFLNVVMYEDGLGRHYIDAVTPEGEQDATKIDLLLAGQGIDLENGQMEARLKMIVNPSAPAFPMDGEEPGGEEMPPAPMDWLALEQEIRDGDNYRATLLTLDLTAGNEGAQGNSLLGISLFTSGMNLGMSLESHHNQETLEGLTTISLGFLMPDLVKVHIRTWPAIDQPQAPVLEGVTPLMIGEDDLSEEDNARMAAALEQALPDLMELLNAALPEEAPALLALLQSGNQEDPEAGPAEDEEVAPEEETGPAEEAEEETEDLTEMQPETTGEPAEEPVEEEAPATP